MSKEMSLANGRSYMLPDDEAKLVIEQMVKGNKNSIFIKRLGMAVNVASIMSVSEPETIPYFWGNKMNQSMTKVLVEGEWKDFAGSQDQIEYHLKSDPSVIIKKDQIQKYED